MTQENILRMISMEGTLKMIPILQEWWDLVSKTWFCCAVDLALGL